MYGEGISLLGELLDLGVSWIWCRSPGPGSPWARPAWARAATPPSST